ncbi:MAG TPA: undecaprenyldiphospho-muramoylpentapeptide beta-N-acetylglucosaminyltransferase [Candidatus Baltobacteraceae bacterium]|nr:undecaprenyldiphospho-muramoylpentapeptide beta-N-acetylglucosaminyltransferase [Candidatus Baltobacteraceae bacterium]
MRVLFAAGGTGGHIYPAVAIADALAAFADIRFVGSADRLEQSIVPAAGYRLETISSRPLPRTSPLAIPAAAAANLTGIVQAARILLRVRPDLIIATGGYVCFPVMAAAALLRAVRLLRCRLVLFEPNAEPGLTNKMLAPLVDEVWGAFENPRRRLGKTYIRTGIPVRAALKHHVDRAAAAGRLRLDPSGFTIVVVGGSQGARSINAAVDALVKTQKLPPGWQILHITGSRDFAQTRTRAGAPSDKNRIVVLSYLSDMADAYALADVVVARAGASTLGELAATGVPSILIPYPFATGDHQLQNARAFQAAGAALVIEDAKLDDSVLWTALQQVAQPARLAAMRGAARSLGTGDPLERILARIETLIPRKNVRA